MLRGQQAFARRVYDNWPPEAVKLIDSSKYWQMLLPVGDHYNSPANQPCQKKQCNKTYVTNLPIMKILNSFSTSYIHNFGNLTVLQVSKSSYQLFIGLSSILHPVNL
jgi:hypothetical protein